MRVSKTEKKMSRYNITENEEEEEERERKYKATEREKMTRG